MQSNEHEKFLRAADEKLCGIAENLCAFDEKLCGIAEKFYDLAEKLCGIAEILKF